MNLSASKKIKPRQLEAFRAAMIHGSASAAAESLHISQPAVSRLLFDLEQSVGFPLFERQGRGLQPTADGRLLNETVERVYLGLEAVQEAAAAIREGDAGKLRIGALPVYAGGYFAEQVGRFIALHPKIRVELESADRNELLAGLLAHRFDLAISTVPVEYPGITEETLGEREAVCILPPGHPLAAKRHVSLTALKMQPFIGLTEANPFRHVIQQSVELAGGSITEVAIARTQRAVSLMVSAGAGISIVDPEVCHQLKPGLVAVRKLKPGIFWKFGILTPTRASRSVAAERFIQHLKSIDFSLMLP